VHFHNELIKQGTVAFNINEMNYCMQQKKGTKVVTGAVPFQKVHFCTQRLHIG